MSRGVSAHHLTLLDFDKNAFLRCPAPNPAPAQPPLPESHSEPGNPTPGVRAIPCKHEVVLAVCGIGSGFVAEAHLRGGLWSGLHRYHVEMRALFGGRWVSRGPGLVPALFPAPLARSALEPATTTVCLKEIRNP